MRETVLINIWATWCGPGRAEHPHFQKLYERLKDRKDVAVISLDVDDQLGLVGGYLKEQVAFLSLFAERLVREPLDMVSIPRKWLVDQNGAHRL